MTNQTTNNKQTDEVKVNNSPARFQIDSIMQAGRLIEATSSNTLDDSLPCLIKHLLGKIKGNHPDIKEAKLRLRNAVNAVAIVKGELEVARKYLSTELDPAEQGIADVMKHMQDVHGIDL